MQIHDINGDLPRNFSVADLPRGGADFTVNATRDECVKIAKRANLPGVGKFSADFHLSYLPHSEILSIRGMIRAEYTQICVLSLDHFTQDQEIEFEVQALDQAKMAHSLQTHEAIDTAEETYEPIIAEHMDLGELAVQQFLVHIDPYPKKPGAKLAEMAELGGSGRAENPFLALKELKNK